MTADQPYAACHRGAQVRLRTLATELGERGLRRPLANGWTVSALLAHLAFWDRYALASIEE